MSSSRHVGPIHILSLCAILAMWTPGCDDALPSAENSSLTCADSLDNDRDGLIDCLDPQCSEEPVCAATCGPCDEPPAPHCKPDGKVLLRYADAGACQDDRCVYPSEEVICPTGCSDSACNDDPCAGVTCEQPPGFCFAATGTCNAGGCTYDYNNASACDDGDACTTNDTCQVGACSGTPVRCSEAPAPTCKDDQTLITSDPQGACSEGACSYRENIVTCEFGCDAQQMHCKGDPCSATLCDKPPGPCYQSTGLCSNGACNYLFADGAQCDDNDACTESDSCLSGGCSGTPKVCDQPPTARCKDDKILVTYHSTGSCQAGQCNYTSQEVACPSSCDQTKNSCKDDPCQSVVCTTPPSACHQGQGSCSNGLCNYAPDDGKSCDDGDSCTDQDSCNAGKCEGTPKNCLNPPQNSCKDTATLIVYTTPGTCSSGNCSYSSSEVACANGCDSGSCKGDPCATVVCDSPPNTQCYAAKGVCSGGSCTYVTQGGACDDSDPCTEKDTCSNGLCAGTAKICQTPPSSICKGTDTVVTFGSNGSCQATNGSCVYPSTARRCDSPPKPKCQDTSSQLIFSNNGSCKDGACVYPSKVVPCDSPPANVCTDKKTLKVYSSKGTCNLGLCSYSSKLVTCSGLCLAGSCGLVAEPPSTQ